LQHCGLVHLCAVDGPKIRHHKSLEIDQGAQAWIREHGVGSVMLLTLTLPHEYGDRLVQVLTMLRRSLTALFSGKAWTMDGARFGVRGRITAHDLTHGANGFHPHLHLLLFLDQALSDDDLAQLARRLSKRWGAGVVRNGGARPSREHGVRLERARNRQDVTRYIAQVVAGNDDDTKAVPVALEVARGDLKTSRKHGQRTLWQVLDDLRVISEKLDPSDADKKLIARDRAIWREYETAIKGVPCIRWSRGLRALCGLGVQEATDAEIVAQEVGGVTLYRFPDNESWRAVRATRGVPVALLRVAELDGKSAVEKLVRETVLAWRARQARRVKNSSFSGAPIGSDGELRPRELAIAERPSARTYNALHARALLEALARESAARMDAEPHPASVDLLRDRMGPHRRDGLSWDAVIILETLGEPEWRDIEQLGYRTLRPRGFTDASLARLRDAGWRCIA
jgi:hypothetical protein